MNLLDIFFPRRCVSCGKIGKYFCEKCKIKIKLTTHQICPVCTNIAIDGITHPKCQTRFTIDGLTSFFHYDGPVKSAVKLLKYRFVTDLAKEFADLIPLMSFNNETMKQFNNMVLIPVPLHTTRLRFRGFNQAEVLGKLLAKRLNIQIRTNILKRVRKTTPQVEMKDRKKRLKNMENVFSIPRNILISSYLNIFLFDDVFTTGTTLRSAANILKRAGAKKVWGIVMAHG